tara:strand:+ start:455 stop:1042 length:588 start_codon:yes stop_codon:yes gene_type:complete
MCISEKRLRNFIKLVILENTASNSRLVVNDENIEDLLSEVEDAYKGHFSWDVDDFSDDDISGYSFLMSEPLYEVIFGSKKGHVRKPPTSFAHAHRSNRRISLARDRSNEHKSYLDPSFIEEKFKIRIEPIRSNKRNENRKFGSFEFSEDMTSSFEIPKENFYKLFQYIYKKTKKIGPAGIGQNITKGMQHLDLYL